MTRRSEGNCRANTAGFKDGGRSVSTAQTCLDVMVAGQKTCSYLPY